MKKRRMVPFRTERWHFIEDGPPKENQYMCAAVCVESASLNKAFWEFILVRYKNGKYWYDDDTWTDGQEIYYWIELPEPPTKGA